MKKRVLPNEVPAGITLATIEKGGFMPVWFLSYCLLVGPAERFIVRTASRSMRTIDDAELKNELRTCFFQEVKHAESHEVFSRRFFAEHPLIRNFNRFSAFLNYQVLDRLLPHSLKLSIASAMEQLNSEIGYFGLETVPDMEMPEAFKEMLCWHFVEEIEHREVVFKLLHEVQISRFYYYLGLLLALFSFSFWITAGAALILLGRPLTFLKGLFHSVRRGGVLRRLLRSGLRYCGEGYHPAQEPIPSAFSLYQDQVNAYVYVPRPLTEGVNA